MCTTKDLSWEEVCKDVDLDNPEWTPEEMDRLRAFVAGCLGGPLEDAAWAAMEDGSGPRGIQQVAQGLLSHAPYGLKMSALSAAITLQIQADDVPVRCWPTAYSDLSLSLSLIDI